MSFERVVAAEISYLFLSAVLDDSTLIKHPATGVWDNPTFSFLGTKVPEEVDEDLNHLFQIEFISAMGSGQGRFDRFARRVAEGREDNRDMLIRLADFFASEADDAGIRVGDTEYWSAREAHNCIDAITAHVPGLAKLVAA